MNVVAVRRVRVRRSLRRCPGQSVLWPPFALSPTPREAGDFVDRHGLEDLRRRNAIEKDERTVAPLRKRPHWWDWELELSEHAEDCMEERGTDQLGLRWMLHHCSRWRRSRTAGRFIVEATYRGTAWEIVLDPDYDRQCIVVVTMYTTEVR